jgi:DNA-binding CsgD family transcriptional regulator
MIAPDFRIGDGAGDTATLLRILDCVDSGILLVSADLRPIFVNDRAAAILAANDGLHIAHGALTAARSADRRAISAAVRALVQRRVERYRLLVERPMRRAPLILTMLPVADDQGAAERPAAVVFIREADAAVAIDRAGLAAAFALTGRESEIATLIAGGRNPAGVAAALGIGVGTVRNHLKRIFEKTDTHRQSELATLARGFADPLG